MKEKILNDIRLLDKEYQKKVKALLELCRLQLLDTGLFETLRMSPRQKELYAIGRTIRVNEKPVTRTMNSYHLTWKAVDIIFYNKWKITREWDYATLTKLAWYCWMTWIFNKQWARMERCHFQDDWRSIAKVIEDNSTKRKSIALAKTKDILHSANNLLRKYK